MATFKRKGLYLDEVDRQLITAIMGRYGCVTESQAVRLALRALGARPLLPTIPLPPAGTPGPQPKKTEEVLPQNEFNLR